MTLGLFAVYGVIYLLIFMTGAVVASFLNVVIYRLPKKESFVSGRSHCVSCGAALGVPDMVPVFSYIFLRGRCRHCGEPFSPRYAVVEAPGGVLAVLAYVRFGATLYALCCFAVFAGLILAAFIDLDTMTIPNGVVIYLLIPAAALCFLLPGVPLLAHAIGFFCISVPLLLFALIIPDSFGGGDIKLFAVCGLALGWRLSLFAAFIALIIGGAWGAYLLAGKRIRRGEHIVFGPAIAVGVALALLWGDGAISWYLGLF